MFFPSMFSFYHSTKDVLFTMFPFFLSFFLSIKIFLSFLQSTILSLSSKDILFTFFLSFFLSFVRFFFLSTKSLFFFLHLGYFLFFYYGCPFHYVLSFFLSIKIFLSFLQSTILSLSTKDNLFTVFFLSFVRSFVRFLFLSTKSLIFFLHQGYFLFFYYGCPFHYVLSFFLS